MTIWNPTKLDKASDCRLMYHLIYVQKVPEILTGPMAVGIRIHEDMEKHFWVRDKQTGLLRPRYKSAEAFANASKAKFDYVARRGTLRGKQIEWKDDKEKYILANDVWDICYKVYETIVNDGPPIAAEYPIEPFQIDGRWFNGRIDEIRIDKTTGLPLIRDFKTGSRRPGEMKRKYDPQATIYC
ncbi:MAG: PD-(D/E)XK nuclease family protein, partial [Candidatus Pacearchaeota archaeon]|nr:PD-(D/E)XK nuclease family protein [Candidatus Pacearchaeota archaeon]